MPRGSSSLTRSRLSPSSSFSESLHSLSQLPRYPPNHASRKVPKFWLPAICSPAQVFTAPSCLALTSCPRPGGFTSLPCAGQSCKHPERKRKRVTATRCTLGSRSDELLTSWMGRGTPESHVPQQCGCSPPLGTSMLNNTT